MQWLIEKLSRGQDTLVYMNSGTSDTSVHDREYHPCKGVAGMMSFAIASQHDAKFSPPLPIFPHSTQYSARSFALI